MSPRCSRSGARRRPPAPCRARRGDPARPARRAAAPLDRRLDVLGRTAGSRRRTTGTRTPTRRRRSRRTLRSPSWAAPGATRRRSTGRRSRWPPSRSHVPRAVRDAVAAWIVQGSRRRGGLAAALLAARLARRPALAIALVGWNPLLAVHLAGGGHNDAWVGALVLAALALVGVSPAAGGRRALGARDRGQVGAARCFLALRALEARATRPARRLPRSRRRGCVVVAVVATVRYGGAWPLAVVPLARQRGTRDELRDPAPAEQLGFPDARRARRWRPRPARRASRGSREAAPRAGAARPRGVPLLVTTPYLAVWYLALGGAARGRGGRRCRRDGRRARALRLPAAPDDPALDRRTSRQHARWNTRTPSSARTTSPAPRRAGAVASAAATCCADGVVEVARPRQCRRPPSAPRGARGS